MKTKRYIEDLNKHAKRFTSAWDYFICATGGYFAGYNYRKEHGELADEEIEVPDLKDGDHQLTAKTFLKHQKEIFTYPLKKLLKIYIPMIDFHDLRVIEKDGIITFQGEGKRVSINKTSFRDAE